MLRESKIDVYNYGTGAKVNGIYKKGDLAFVKTIYGDIQDFSTELFIKQYGENIEVNKMMYTCFDNNIKIGTVLQYTNAYGEVEKGEVKKLLIFKRHMEIFTLGIGGN